MQRLEYTETTCTKMAAIAEDRTASSDDEEQRPQLSEHAMAALQEFYAEQEERQLQFEAHLAKGARAGGVAIEEDWVRGVDFSKQHNKWCM